MRPLPYPVAMIRLVPRYGFRCLSQRCVRHRRVAPHHPLCLPSPERHHDRCCETLVERHRRTVVPKIVDVEVTEARSARSLAELAADVGAIVRPAIRPGKHPIILVCAELVAKDFLRVRAENHRPRAPLRSWEEDDPLL